MNQIPLLLFASLCLCSVAEAAPLQTELTPDNRLLIRRAGQAESLLAQNARANFRPYIHPILAPDGQGVLTEDAPGHHTWQHGLYVGLHKVNGHDFWTRDHAFRPRPLAAPIAAGNRVTWQVETGWLGQSNDPAPIINETQRWTLTDHGDHYLLDLEWTLTAAVDVTFGKHEYGGLFLRMPWTRDANGDALSSEGKPADGQRARWLAVRMDIAGRDDGATIAILDHPQNPAHPAPWRLDGQLGIAPSRCILGDWKLAKGESTTSRYRVIVRGGRAKPEALEAEFKRFASITR